MSNKYELYIDGQLITNFMKQTRKMKDFCVDALDKLHGKSINEYMNYSKKQQINFGRRYEYKDTEEKLWTYILYLYATDKTEKDHSVRPFYIGRQKIADILEEYKKDLNYLNNLNYLQKLCKIAAIIYKNHRMSTFNILFTDIPFDPKIKISNFFKTSISGIIFKE